MDYKLDAKLILVHEDERGNKIFAGENSVYDYAMFIMPGSGNSIYIGKDSKILKFKIHIAGSANLIVIGERCILRGGVSIKAGKKHSLHIGDGTTFQSVNLFVGEGKSITIGRDCMFSARIEIRTTDSHSVINVDTGERVNYPGSVVIGDHVWIGKDAIISKGVTLHSNMIVGAKAFVNRSFNEQYIAIGGVPAKVVKSRVDWSRKLMPIPAGSNN